MTEQNTNAPVNDPTSVGQKKPYDPNNPGDPVTPTVPRNEDGDPSDTRPRDRQSDTDGKPGEPVGAVTTEDTDRP